MKQLMTGNEAIARGAWEAGVRFASAYPGTPSTEILENLAAYREIDAEWAPNEKVAVEAAIGASFAGARAMASMKHVGVNVAADPLFTFAYTGVGGGMVLVSADEPGMHSSQNEQDNRRFAKMAKIPMLEPSDSQECLDMVKLGFAVSEEFDTPVLLRVTTRICHSKSIVECGEREEIPIKDYQKNPAKTVMVPAMARGRRMVVEERMKRLAQYAERTPLNKTENPGKNTGVIASGVAYCYAREVFGDGVSYLKLAFTNPLPAEKLQAFCESVDKVYIIEETDPVIEEAVAAISPRAEVAGKSLLPAYGELTPDVLRERIFGGALPHKPADADGIVPRPPTLCAGCPHRGLFYELGRRKDVVVSGDIGCYTLAFAPPYSAMDWTICMGSSLSAGHGAQKVFNQKQGSRTRVVSVLGDSTFLHTGIHSLLEVVYNGSNTVNIILDNRITGMTGHQQNPGSGFNAKGGPAAAADIEALARAVGIRHVAVVDPNDLAGVREALDRALALDEPSVIITRWPCVLKRMTREEKEEFHNPFTRKYRVNGEKCIGCKICLRGGCPALSMDPQRGKAAIDAAQCAGCSVCAQLCPKNAIGEVQ